MKINSKKSLIMSEHGNGELNDEHVSSQTKSSYLESILAEVFYFYYYQFREIEVHT